jgi:hypothetical protein
MGKSSTALMIVLLVMSGVFFVVLSGDEREFKIEEERAGGEYNEGSYLQSIFLGGEWFLSNQNEEFLYYQYLPFKGEHPSDRHYLREMGALWAVTNLANFFGDEDHEDLAVRGFDFFEKSFEEDSENGFVYVDINPEKRKLGYSAFMILSLLEIDHEEKDYYLDRLAEGIIYQQNDDGSLRTHFYSDYESSEDYYPGEALLALMSLYEYNGEKKHLDAVGKAFPYYRKYWRGNKNTAFVPWQTRAYVKFYRATGRVDVRDFVFEMNDYMLNEYDPTGDCSGFIFVGKDSVAAVHQEGVNKAYSLAKEVDDDERVRCYGNFILESSSFVKSLQITSAIGGRVESVGGFIGGNKRDSMRADRNQHAVMALMDAYNLGLIE